MSDLHKTVKYASIYAIGVLLNRAVGFIMLPIYTRLLTPSDYGIIELLTLTVDLVSMLIGVGIAAAIIKFYYFYEQKKDRNEVVSTALILLSMLYLLGCLLGIIFSKYLSILVFDTIENKYFFQLMFSTLFFQPLIEIPFIFIKAQQRPLLFVVASTGKLILQLALNIYFVVILKMGVLGVLYSTLVASAIIGLALVIYTFIVVGWSFSKEKAIALIVFGAPLIISNFSDFILTFSDRYFLKAYAGLTKVGIYSLGYKFGFMFWMIIVIPFFNIWEPQRFEVVKEDEAKVTIQRAFFYFNLSIISVALGISLFGRDLLRIMSNPSYYDAHKIIPLIMIAYIIQAWTAFGNFGVIYKGKTKYIAFGTTIGAIAIVVFSFILIPVFSMYGAAIATILAFFIRFFIIYIYSQKLYKLHLKWAKIILLMIIALIILLVSSYFQQENLMVSIMLNVFLFIGFVVSILIFPVFNTAERKIIFDSIRNPLISLRSAGFRKN